MDQMPQEITQQHELHEELCRLVEEFLGRMNISCSVEETNLLDGICFDVKTPEGGVLIGENGQHLFALSTLIKRIAEKRFQDNCPPFTVDINDYQRKRIEEMKERARMSAQRVRYFKKEVIMQPMSAYERRVVHMTLQEDPDVITESMGDGENRRVVIKPAKLEV